MGIKVSTSLTGKMEGMTVITTSMTANDNCKRLAQIPGTICSKCYSERALSYRPTVKTCYEKNGDILSGGILKDKDLPEINSQFCRLESHGDLLNETHLMNYINIAKKNPCCTFALWSKQYRILYQVFKRIPQPDNMIIVISSPYINREINVEPFRKIGMTVKSFTVFDKEHASDDIINCGGRKCIECMRCYHKDTENSIYERLK